MCGRYTLRTPSSVLVKQFMLQAAPDLPPRDNICPTQNVPVVRRTLDDPQRRLVLLRWGLIPSWAKDAKIGNSLINARSETVAEKPAFRAAFRRRRCLVPADGYYEWKLPDAGDAGPFALQAGKGKRKAPKKQQYLIHFPDDRPFAFAGLWEWWEGSPDSKLPGPIESCTIITSDANEATRHIHDRMPVILPESAYDLWLDPQMQDPAPLMRLLTPYADDGLRADAVGPLR